MTQSGENKELKAAFDEFKELMEKRVEPIFEMPPLAPTENEAKVEPKAHFDTELKVGAPTFSIPRQMSPEQAQPASRPDISLRVAPTNSFSTTRPITAPQSAGLKRAQATWLRSSRLAALPPAQKYQKVVDENWPISLS